MKTLVNRLAQFVSIAFVFGAASMANAATVVETISENYLYESLIQTEFDIENNMRASVEQTTQSTFQQVLIALETDMADEKVAAEEVAD